MNPKISVLVPIYNVESYIERCAISLLEQTYDNCEFIFVNDCTKDNSIKILQKVMDKYPHLSGKIKIINHSQNMGLGAARLTGVENSDGEYITFVDSDDYVDRLYVEKLVKTMLEMNSDVVLSSYNIKDKIMTVSSDWYEKHVLGGRLSCRIWGSLLKRQIMDTHSIYPIRGIDYAEDFMFMTRYMSEAKTINIIPDFIYYYTTDNQNSYVHNVSDKDITSLYHALNTVSDYFQKNRHRKYEKIINYGILEKAKGLVERGQKDINVDKILSLLNIKKMNLFEKTFLRSIQCKNSFLMKSFSRVCYIGL